MSKNDEFCIKNEELCIKNEELRIKNQFCRPAGGGRLCSSSRDVQQGHPGGTLKIMNFILKTVDFILKMMDLYR